MLSNGDICRRKAVWFHEGHVVLDRIHLLLSIPVKFSLGINTMGN